MINKFCCEVILKILDGRSTTFEVERNDSVHRLMHKINERLHIPVETQRLVFAGKPLDENKTLAYYNLTDLSIVFLVLRLRGGSFNETLVI
ncbi:hypothetical protein B4U80_06771 [Leptotrombidium deliense]|uniref:Ubiquitin-like domain-containing protein n=1 Tax=Leptotrombidium deliense TaxID=299467 RepID=A0A443RUB8_9ACAR|nr:hypothetical protein B4U80_06771 [Leptotrombidium deliense]